MTLSQRLAAQAVELHRQGHTNAAAHYWEAAKQALTKTN